MLFAALFFLYVVISVLYSCALSTLRKVKMMNNNIYAVYDSCSGLFGDPFIAPNDASAQRVFTFSLSNPDLPKYIRDDAVLYALGCFDSKTGCFTIDVPPYVVLRGSSVVVRDVSRETAGDLRETAGDLRDTAGDLRETAGDLRETAGDLEVNQNEE